jgi:hypothetical protein
LHTGKKQKLKPAAEERRRRGRGGGEEGGEEAILWMGVMTVFPNQTVN